MKYLIGFIFGVSTACAFAETYEAVPVPKEWLAAETVLMAAVNPKGHASIIKVDDEGHVICSTKAGE